MTRRAHPMLGQADLFLTLRPTVKSYQPVGLFDAPHDARCRASTEGNMSEHSRSSGEARAPQIRYRCPTTRGQPPTGAIVMADGPRVRRGCRILKAVKVRSSMVMLGMVTWRLSVESMSSAAAREEIAAGAPHWGIKWDRR